MSNIKTFISNTKDTARLAFGKYAETYPRHCVFIGSTNDTTFLRDNTSVVERRFWVIKCNKKNKDARIFEVLTQEYINQLWAESVYYYKENPNMYLDITQDYMDDFANEMMQFKTFNDDSVIEYARNILEKTYYLNDKGEFYSEMDLFKQYTENNEYETGKRCKINKLPYSFLRYVLKNHYHEERTGTYIANGLGKDWKYKSIRYKDRPCKGFERQGAKQDLFCN